MNLLIDKMHSAEENQENVNENINWHSISGKKSIHGNEDTYFFCVTLYEIRI